jgi:hypothetical protein
LDKYSTLAYNVLSVTGDEAKIIIADEIKGLSFTNMDAPAIYIRYFLLTNSVGGQFLGLSRDERIDRAMTSDADYLLLLSYKDTFKHCEDLFEKGHTYLIKFNGPIDQSTSECPFTKDAIVDYENQGK